MALAWQFCGIAGRWRTAQKSRMAKCEQCNFPHAIPGYCSNCGSGDPLPSRKLLRLAIIIFGLIILAALASVPITLYIQRTATFREYPAAVPIPSPTPVR